MVTNTLLESDVRPRKRTRTDEITAKDAKTQKYRLFAPFRALGLVTNHIPFVLQARSFKGATEGPRINIVTCLGRSWAMWEGGKMTLLFIGPDCELPIACLAMNGDAVWASTGPHIIKYLRGKEVGRLTNPLESNLSSIYPFGDQMLSLSEDGSTLLIWDCTNMELASSIQFENGFTATIILHPATYLNKVLVASKEGDMQLWNIKTQTCIHKFEGNRLRDSTDPSAVTALVQSPAIDVVAIGFSSGEVSLYDIRADERLMRIYMDDSPIRSLSFRSDGQAVLASASSKGHIALWDLNNGGRLLHVIRGAHDRAVTAIEWVPGQPVLVSSGEDNSVKQWFFESPSAPPRLLKFRSGHHEPPHLIRFYGDDGKQLLTASRDRSLRCTSVVRDSRSFELSQGSLSKKATALSIPVANMKFPPITQLAYSTTRSKDWDDVLTAHKQESVARTWTVRDKKLGKWVFNLNDAIATKGKKKVSAGAVCAVCVSACGNFGIAGTSTGAILMYNMQSGIRRKGYKLGLRPPEVASRLKDSATQRLVNGLASDALNKLVIASTSDGTVNFFDFHTEALLHTLVLSSTCSSILLQRDSGLLAVICDDLVVRLVDIETRRIVREFTGFTGNILDVTFSPDSRWMITTSLDSVIRTFDIPSGRLIDAFRTASLATSVSFSPTGDFLATAHVDSVGVYLWANRAQFTDVSLHGVVEVDGAEIALPSLQGTAEDEALDALQSLTVEEPKDVYSTPSQLGGDLITLTLLPRSRWQTLLNLEVIQQRNKPKEPPKPPEKAPFFLPTLPGVEHRFAVTQKDNAQEQQKNSKKLEAGASRADSKFYRKLVSEDPEGDYEDFFVYLKTLTPAGLDLELRALGSSLEGLSTLVGALRQRLRSHRDFEAVQAVIGALLRLHGEVFVANPELCNALEQLREAQTHESRRVLEMITASLGTLSFVRDVL
ncbi:WD40 repeat-like protein [Fomitiporia mediterranea MF3/22]|uniref:WD40 repeat-like protein n=1 Tax=Fomitiporia mediterranea (strain MF3/22) TaxID=694068 RepID=UPI0004407DC0|nr:WD40 repeat-like protein [Fomitiporia mediterranea MF3/22]EJD02387.1 WD40 repeat-like protein [Fomitiporia mediterranea MF3/22]